MVKRAKDTIGWWEQRGRDAGATTKTLLFFTVAKQKYRILNAILKWNGVYFRSALKSRSLLGQNLNLIFLGGRRRNFVVLSTRDG